MKLLTLSALSLVLLSFMPPDKPTPQPPDPYLGCCGTQPVKFYLNNELIYIPNVFTPNHDALNDFFRPFYDATKIKLDSMEVRAITENRLMARKVNIDPITTPFWGWLGFAAKDSIYEGKFNYKMVFSSKITNEKKTITGSACSFVCKGNTQIPIADRNQCFFPMQYSNNDVLTESPIYLEIDCIKP